MSPSHLFPGYVAGTLSAAERQEVDAWLAVTPGAANELAAWRMVRAAVLTQPTPPLTAPARQRIWQGLQSQIHATSQPLAPKPQPPFAWALAFSLAVLLLLWTVLQPGLGLQWSVTGGEGVSAYRIYRAPLGQEVFTLLAEIPAHPAQQEYVYVDTQLWPWETYQYRVESVGASSFSAVPSAARSATINAAPTALWADFAAMLLLSLAAGVGALWVMQQAPQRRLAV